MRCFIIYILLSLGLNGFTQYNDAVIVYQDESLPIVHVKPNFILTNVDDQPFKDILVLNSIGESSTDVSSFHQNELNIFSSADIIQSIGYNSDDQTIFHQDMDGGEDLDIIYKSAFNTISILFNQGNGNYGEPQNIEVSMASAFKFVRVNDIADLDEDGDKDILLTMYRGYDWPPLEDSSKLYIGFNDGDGNITNFSLLETEHVAVYHKVHAADVDGDNDIDILTAGFDFAPQFAIGVPWYEMPFMRWFKNSGEGDFTQIIDLELPQREDQEASYVDLQVGDVEGDGSIDLFTSFAFLDSCEDPIHNFNCDFNYVFSVFSFNEGMNRILPISEFNSWVHDYTIESNVNYYDEAFEPFIDDVNGDGNADILTVSSTRGKILWKLGDGEGFFEDEMEVANVSNLLYRPRLKASDMNMDGDLDVFSLVNRDSSSTLTYYENLEISVIDFDQDGYLSDIDCDDTDSTIADVLPSLDYITPLVICENEIAQFTTLNEIENGLYNWLGPNGFSANTSEPVIEDVELINEGIYEVFVNLGGCVSDTIEIELQVRTAPEIEVLQFGDTLTAIGDNIINYQWFVNGDSVPGATSNFYIAEESGYYNLVVENQEGCQSASDSIQIIISGIGDNVDEIGFEIYPNPVRMNESFYINLSSMQDQLEIELHDLTGKLVFEQKLRGLKVELNKSRIKEGFYLVSIIMEGQILNKRILILE